MSRDASWGGKRGCDGEISAADDMSGSDPKWCPGVARWEKVE